MSENVQRLYSCFKLQAVVYIQLFNHTVFPVFVNAALVTTHGTTQHGSHSNKWV